MKKLNITSKSKFMIVINLFLIFILMTVSVYAWFASNVNNTVDIHEIEVQADNNLELSLDGENWSGSLNLDSLLQDIKFVEVTGNGETFGVPKLDQHTNYALVDTNETFGDATGYYLKFDVYMKSKDQLNVHLSPESFAAPVSEIDTGNDCGNPVTVELADGAVSFSKDCIVGALRVSYEDAGGDRRIWITNPEYHLDNAVGSDKYSMAINGTGYSDGTNAEEGDYIWNRPTVHYYYENKDTFITDTNALTSLGTVGETMPANTKLCTLSESANVLPEGVTKEAETCYGKATFTVWLEGCDTEARKALLGGKFKLSLVLDSYTN